MNKMNTNALVMPWHPEEPAAKPRKGWASRFAGVWKDSRSAEEKVGQAVLRVYGRTAVRQKTS